jgi:hypothetical protein
MIETVTVVKAWDDIKLAESGQKVEAAGTFSLEWNGERVLLDLTSESALEIDAAVRKYLKIGRKDNGKTRHKAKIPGPSTGHRGRKAPEFYTAMREFADASNGEYTYSEDPARPGKFNYSAVLREAFEPVWEDREHPASV